MMTIIDPDPSGHPNSVVITDGTTTDPDSAQGRAGNDLNCANCGKRLRPERGSRRMRYCNGACRQSAFRAKKWASRYEGRGPYDQFEIRPSYQGPATAILGIEDRAIAAR
jgi:hypothetical protein